MLRKSSSRELHDKGGVLGCRDAALQDLEDRGNVAPEHGRAIKPQPGENAAANNAFRIWGKGLVVAISQFKPVDRLVTHAPHEVLADSVALIDAELGIEIDALSARR